MDTGKQGGPTRWVIFQSARQFHHATEKLRAGGAFEVVREFGYPTLYCAMMASELYLKCMVFGFHGTVPKHHDLERLFNSLPVEAKRGIDRRWEEHRTSLEGVRVQIKQHFGAEIDTSLKGALRGAEQWNENLRYLWEASPTSFTVLQSFPAILQAVLLEDLGEEWVSVGRPR